MAYWTGIDLFGKLRFDLPPVIAVTRSLTERFEMPSVEVAPDLSSAGSSGVACGGSVGFLGETVFF